MYSKIVTRVGLFCFIVVLGCGVAVADVPTGAQNAVDRFCQLDMDGARMGFRPVLSDKIRTLVRWDKEPDWNVWVVVRAFNSHLPGNSPAGLRTFVDYEVIGEMIDGFWAPRGPKAKSKRVKLILHETPKGWQIKSPILPPHVSIETAVDFLEGLLREPISNTLEKNKLENSLKALRAISTQ